MALVVMDPGITAALAVGLASYAGYFLQLSPIGMKVVAVSSILLLAAVNISDEIVAYFIFVVVIFLVLSNVALFVLRRRAPNAGLYRTPGYPATPIAFIALAVTLLVLLGSGSPRQSSLGVVVVALGLPLYYLFVHPKKVDATASREPTIP